MTQNPLLQKFSQLDQAVPFDLIKVEHYLPALKTAIEQAKKELAAIKENSAAPTFQNTIEALETTGELSSTISTIYGNLEVAHASPEHQALAQEIYPMLTAFSSDISLDEKLFLRVKSVYDQMASINLTTEEKTLLDKQYKSFARNGALLNATDKEKLRQIDQELSVLGPKFSENVLKETNNFEMWISDKKDLDGLPEGVIEAAAMTAKEKGKAEAWFFGLQIPSFLPFMTYAKNRTLREKLWKASNAKSMTGEFSNQEIILKIVQLRHQRAQLLGSKNHAEFVLTERMAQNPETVMQFLDKLITAYKPVAEKDLQEIKAFAMETDSLHDVMPWDFGYYSEKLKEKKYAFNEEDLRPYFQLEKVVAGVFEHAEKLYQLKFVENKTIPVYHPEVKVYEVFESTTDKYMGLFYTDFFPRDTKKGGAWMTEFRGQGLGEGKIHRPHVSIVCNFTKPTPTKPSLLSYDEVQTLFHEFGHALHGMLSDVKYRSLAGPNVYWDFVELPSQIMENWVGEKEGLDVFARHYQTQEPMPLELVQKIKKASQFQAGWMAMRQLQFGLMDMKWHSTDPSTITNVDTFETEATRSTRLLPKIEGTNNSCSFSHIFAGGYSAGYYSYKWAEVLDADAFELFKEKGLFDKEVAKKFKDHILSKGGTEHPMDLYIKFRGREPDPEALLRRTGLI